MEITDTPKREKYLTVQILGSLKVNCFKNKHHEENPKAPHFKGDGIAIWVNQKKEKIEEVQL